MKNWYTRKEAADKLGVSMNTIYHYYKQGKIKKIPDPHRLHREVRYEKAEIDQLAAEMEEQPDGLSPAHVAKQLGISVQLVYKHIREGTIEASEVPVGDERFHYVISEESLEKVKEELRPQFGKIRRTEYYDSSRDIALFQHFYSAKIPTARIMKNEKQQWCFYLPITQKWISYEEGIGTNDLVPFYSIHQPSLQGSGYVKLLIKKDEDVFYPFIDYLFNIWGVENVRIRDKGESAYIVVKSGAKPFEEQPFSVEELIPFVIEGSIYFQENFFITESGYRKTSLELPILMHEQIKTLAEKEKITMSEWVEQALKKVLKNSEGNH